MFTLTNDTTNEMYTFTPLENGVEVRYQNVRHPYCRVMPVDDAREEYRRLVRRGFYRW